MDKSKFDKYITRENLIYLIVISSILVVAIVLLSINLYLARQKISASSTASAKQTELYNVTVEENNKLKDEISSLQKKSKKQDEEISELYNFKQKAISGKWESKAEFLDKYIVIVTTTGKCYHRYNCQHTTGGSFWAYNVDAAVSKGYSACSDCDPPKVD